MKKLYMKDEVGFALLWIGLYVVLFSIADQLSALLGVEKIVTAPLCVAMTAFLWLWIRKNRLSEKYGLCGGQLEGKKALRFWPLALISSVNIWGGVTLRFSPAETALYVLSMLCVGFIEEVIFRGFLFKALCAQSLKTAVCVSSVTFGLGHIVNLLNGAALGPTVLQIGYATAIGFLFTVLFWKWHSLWPCIVTHSVVNALSAFAVERSMLWETAVAGFVILTSVVYAVWIRKEQKESI